MFVLSGGAGNIILIMFELMGIGWGKTHKGNHKRNHKNNYNKFIKMSPFFIISVMALVYYPLWVIEGVIIETYL